MTKPRIQLLIALTVAIGGFFYFELHQALTLDNLKSRQDMLSAYHNAHPLLTVLIYASIYIVVTGLSLPGATLLTLAGGAIFGVLWGTLIVSFASSIGATLAFLAARFLFRDVVKARLGEYLETIDQGIDREGAYYLFTLRLVPLFPFFAINLAMGLTRLRTFTFYWVSQLGMLAGTLVYVNAGTRLAQIDSLSGILSPALVGSFALLGVFPIIAKKIVENLPR